MAGQMDGVAWREWGKDAFAEARERDVPVLLDIGAVWCHWCHVMDEGIPGDPVHTGTYSDPAVQARIREHFIPVKVDNDRRPDINARYNMGGWPTTAFLSPDGEPLYGETYVPPPRMTALLDYMSDMWRNRRDEVRAQTRDMHAQRARAEAEIPAADALDSQTVPFVLHAIAQAFDPEHGGFGSEPKFPHPDVLLLALEQLARMGNESLREVVVVTLAGMAGGGMYDQYAGGFFRYSTTRDWSIPHYEKMLEDNARLTRVYARAAQVLQMSEWMDIVKSAHSWLLTTMRDLDTGAFSGSQDADAEEAYYGQSLAERAQMPTPYIDRTVYAGWNALMVSALATRYQATGEVEILDAAQQTFTLLVDRFCVIQSNMIFLRHYSADGHAQGGTGLLADQTAFVHAALDLYETTGSDACLKAARQAGEATLRTLEDTAGGGFYDLHPDPEAIGELARPKKDMSENAETALAFLRLSTLTEDARYRDAGERALKTFTRSYKSMGYFAATYARAVDAYSRPALHIIVTGREGDIRLVEMQRAAWAIAAPSASVETLDSDHARQRGYPPAEDESPHAFICIGTRCLAPVTTPAALAISAKQELG